MVVRNPNEPTEQYQAEKDDAPQPNNGLLIIKRIEVSQISTLEKFSDVISKFSSLNKEFVLKLSINV